MQVLLIDQYALNRASLRALLVSLAPGLVIHESDDLYTALARLQAEHSRLLPDLIVLNSRAASSEDIAQLRLLMPKVPVIVIAIGLRRSEQRAYLAAGTCRCVPSGARPDDLRAALHAAVPGGPALASKTLDGPAPGILPRHAFRDENRILH